jgi:hypothetical protein
MNNRITGSCSSIAAVGLLWAGNALGVPYQCGLETVTDAETCGTTFGPNAAQCGTTHEQNDFCGSQWVTDEQQCGTESIAAWECGEAWTRSERLCGAQWTQSAIQCGTTFGYDAYHCGEKTVTSGVACGWNYVTSLFGLLRTPKACKVALACEVPNTCKVANECVVPLVCDRPASCSITKTCDVPKECEHAASCEVESCGQAVPFGECEPGVAECKNTGHSCQWVPSAASHACLPDYDPALDFQDSACWTLFDFRLQERARVAGKTHTYAVGYPAADSTQVAVEVGAVFGEDGQFGCFVTSYEGDGADLDIARYTAQGVFESWDDFSGAFRLVSDDVSLPDGELEMTGAAVLAENSNRVVGTHFALSDDEGAVPADGGHLTGQTRVNQLLDESEFEIELPKVKRPKLSW